MDFVPLSTVELDTLGTALKRNVNNKAIMMDPKDTTFMGTDELTEDEVVNAIRSIPLHY